MLHATDEAVEKNKKACATTIYNMDKPETSK